MTTTEQITKLTRKAILRGDIDVVPTLIKAVAAGLEESAGRYDVQDRKSINLIALADRLDRIAHVFEESN